MQVDFVSDVICPWCFIGLARLEQALEKVGVAKDVITFHPFQLDPSTPAEGADLRERLRAKYGADPEAMFERVVSAAKESGIALDFAKVRRTPNTLKAHLLITKAKEKGRQYAVAKALFEAYFLEGLDVGKDDVLVAIAAKQGFDADEAAALLGDEAALEETRAAARELAEQGIGGVPFAIFEQKLAVSGAQAPETFVQAIEKAKTLPSAS